MESGDAHIGYHYDYSAYGMIYQIQQWRGMTLNPDGSIASNGALASTTTYNYQGTPVNPTPAGGLSDAPTYTTRTDDWAGRTSSQLVWYFSVNQTSGISTVTAPDGTVSETHAIVHQGYPDDGLITDTIIKVGASELSHTVLQWDPNGVSRLSSTRNTNESGQTKAVVYDQYDDYNNVGRVSEHDFTSDGSVSPTELRRTETSYFTPSAYTSRGLIHLPLTVKVFTGGSTQPSGQTDYGYDESSLISYPDLNSSMMYADPGTTARGNLSRVTTYADAANAGGAINHLTTYDIAGNVKTVEVDCCQQKSIR